MTVHHCCGSTRILEGETIHCDRRFGHPPQQKHRATMSDLTTILWDGDHSENIESRSTQ